MSVPDQLLWQVLAAHGRSDRLTHVETLPARPAVHLEWPDWLPKDLVRAWELAGIDQPWSHQVEMAELARTGQSVVISTGTASGKSLGYLMPSLTAAAAGVDPLIGSLSEGRGRRSTTLYIAPTKALAADQLRRIRDLGVPGIRVATYDGDTPGEEREWVRSHANFVLTNPDMVHHSLLPGHHRWAAFLRSLDFVVIDEMHNYRGLFGAHVSAVLRRLRRVCERYHSEPTFLLASATISQPSETATRLTGLDVTAVTKDSSPKGPMTFALWEPPLTDLVGEQGAPVRRTAAAEVADMVADLVIADVRTLAFVRSRRGAEVVALLARHSLEEVDGALGRRVAAYRAGYLPEERRLLEGRLHSGDLRAVAATSALELGIDVSGLDVVLLAGWPGTRASLWQQAGRAGRAGQGSLAVLVARDDPLDTYLVHHPEAIFGQPVEASVFDPENPYVLGPHLAAAAAELPLVPSELALFGASTESLLAALVEKGLLRRRPAGWYWTKRERATDLADLRGIGGTPVRIVEEATGRLLGTVDLGAAHGSVHEGAVYVHQGSSYIVSLLDLEEATALVRAAEPDYTTSAREITDLSVIEAERQRRWGDATLNFGVVEVTQQVVAYLRRRIATGEVLGEEALTLPPRTLRTKAVWWTFADTQIAQLGISSTDLPGSLHAAEHASIGLLPLFATCDRWDIGGVSTAHHPDTAQATVFVYDGHAGGAGFAEQGYAKAKVWLSATQQVIADCECTGGCPSCIQSPKCGNGNEPLSKAGALAVLGVLLHVAL